MRIRVIHPIASGLLNEEHLRDASQYKAPDTEIEEVNLDEGSTDLISFYEEALHARAIIEKAVQAEKDGCDGVFITCFADPAVDASREQVSIPVVGGFQPAALTACLIADRWSVVTVEKSVYPMIRGVARKLGIENNIASIRDIDTPLYELQDKKKVEERYLAQIEQAIAQDGAEAIVLGCTGMIGVAQGLAQKMAARGVPVPVVDPTAAAIGYLELLIRSGLSQSRLTYLGNPRLVWKKAE